jgi:hypothetical protein
MGSLRGFAASHQPSLGLLSNLNASYPTTLGGITVAAQCEQAICVTFDPQASIRKQAGQEK